MVRPELVLAPHPFSNPRRGLVPIRRLRAIEAAVLTLLLPSVPGDRRLWPPFAAMSGQFESRGRRAARGRSAQRRVVSPGEDRALVLNASLPPGRASEDGGHVPAAIGQRYFRQEVTA
jgi:hypothetical protein